MSMRMRSNILSLMRNETSLFVTLQLTWRVILWSSFQELISWVPLYELINNSVEGNRKVFFIHGGVDAEDREQVREITEREDNTIIVASYGTFSTGVNIKRLHNVIFTSPSKSRIRNLQSIGRVLRKGKDKSKAVLYDIADDCTNHSRRNYTLNHFIERVKICAQEQFNYEIIPVDMTD